jgi:hypothetical protein
LHLYPLFSYIPSEILRSRFIYIGLYLLIFSSAFLYSNTA